MRGMTAWQKKGKKEKKEQELGVGCIKDVCEVHDCVGREKRESQ